jgi:hypothetical protein
MDAQHAKDVAMGLPLLQLTRGVGKSGRGCDGCMEQLEP